MSIDDKEVCIFTHRTSVNYTFLALSISRERLSELSPRNRTPPQARGTPGTDIGN